MEQIAVQTVMFFEKESTHVKTLLLADIILMVANIAKHDFRWNDDLGKLDDNVYSEGRYNNLTERFGKNIFGWLCTRLMHY